jgi:hypothetical protein
MRRSAGRPSPRQVSETAQPPPGKYCGMLVAHSLLGAFAVGANWVRQHRVIGPGAGGDSGRRLRGLAGTADLVVGYHQQERWSDADRRCAVSRQGGVTPRQQCRSHGLACARADASRATRPRHDRSHHTRAFRARREALRIAELTSCAAQGRTPSEARERVESPSCTALYPSAPTRKRRPARTLCAWPSSVQRWISGAGSAR